MIVVLQTFVPMGGACTRSPDMVHMRLVALSLLIVLMGGARIAHTEREVPSSKLVWARAV